MAPLSTNAVAHFLHPAHKLTELNDDTPYRCDGCKIIGNGTRFSCVSCQFDLHVYCTKCPSMLISTTNHPHPMSLVVYKPKPHQTDSCQICRNPIQGLVYECKACSFLVHPLCVSRNSGLNQGCVPPSFISTTKIIGEKVAVELATDYIYDTIAKDEDEEPATYYDALGNDEDSEALGNDEDEEPTADSDALGDDEDEEPIADSDALGNDEDEEPTADSDALGNDEDEKPAADSDALGNDEDEEPTADSDAIGNDEESGSLLASFYEIMSGIGSILSSCI